MRMLDAQTKGEGYPIVRVLRDDDTLDPAMAQILNDNLATMDYYVKECQEAVKNSPDNPLVHRYLLTAYQKKIEIMQSIVNSDVL